MAAAGMPRARWKPRISILGTIGGLMMGLGGVVLLQQYGKLYPTTTIFVGGLIAGVLIAGLVLPSLFRLIAIARINGRMRKIEARQAAVSGATAGATAATLTPPPDGDSEAPPADSKK